MNIGILGIFDSKENKYVIFYMVAGSLGPLRKYLEMYEWVSVEDELYCATYKFQTRVRYLWSNLSFDYHNVFTAPKLTYISFTT